MPKRKSLSKKLRFEVLKRDGFRCQYCGRAPPDVSLVVDHIEPVAAGGSGERANLVTACVTCNLGKGARALGDVIFVKSVRAVCEESVEDFVAEAFECFDEMAKVNEWGPEERVGFVGSYVLGALLHRLTTEGP